LSCPFFLLSKCIFRIMSKDRKSGRRQRLEKLKTLVESLHDRDEQLKRDLKMFDNFMESFPLPVTMWSINKAHVVLSNRGSAFGCAGKKVKTLEEMFECETMRADAIEKHENALTGQPQAYFVQDGDHIYYTRLVPRTNEDGSILGVVGIAWDVTSNAIMISKLEDIVKCVELGGDLEEIKAAAEDALSVSRLRKLLPSEESE